MSEEQPPSSIGTFMAHMLSTVETAPGSGPYTHTARAGQDRHVVSVHKPLQLRCTCGWVSEEDWLEIDIDDLVEAAEDHINTNAPWFTVESIPFTVVPVADPQPMSGTVTVDYPTELKVGDTATYRDGDTEYPLVITAIEPGVHPEMTVYHLESPT